MSFLVDTNVFLEILLNQPARAKCEHFLQQNTGMRAIADFSLHSIGVIALRRRQEKLFADLLNDSLPNLELLHLDRIAKAYGLAIATQDQHFTQVKSDVEVRFI